MPWLELQLIVDAALQPRAEAVLEDAGALSVTLLDANAGTAAEAAVLEPGVGETPLWQSVALLALFDAKAPRAALREAVRAGLPELPTDHIAFHEIADRDWERAWMDRFHPMRFGRRLWIYPWNVEPHRKDRSGAASRTTPGGEGRENARVAPGAATDGPVIVRLDPGLAFGTGTHPTTALCLEWLDAQNLAGKTLIDYGCGSGVLAIAGLKLGAARAIGVDNDPQALIATRENAVRNGVAERLTALVPEAVRPIAPADVFVANILAGPLAGLAPRFASLCRSGAPIAISGILAAQAPELIERYQACGFTGLAITRREDWIRIAGQRA